MKEKIIPAVIIGFFVAIAIVLRPQFGLATSAGNYISKSVQTGTFTATANNGTQNYIEGCENFSPSFSSAPHIQVSLKENTGASITTVAPETVQVYIVNNNSFCVRVGSRDNSNFANNYSVDVNWTAVGN